MIQHANLRVTFPIRGVSRETIGGRLNWKDQADITDTSLAWMFLASSRYEGWMAELPEL